MNVADIPLRGVSAGPVSRAVVLYVCAERGRMMPGLAAQRAQEEGQRFVREHGLALTQQVTDRYGLADPQRRPGWQQVRELAAAGKVAWLVARWPAAIAPESAARLRTQEVRWLAERGVRVRYTWAPLAALQSAQDS